MPRKRGRVRLSGADLALVADHLTDVLPRAIVEIPAAPTDIRELLAPIADTRREQLSKAAVALAGTSDKKSRAYKSARRRLERYVTDARERRGRTRPALRQIAERIRRPHLPTDASILVSRVTADVFYEGQVKTMPAGAPTEISARNLATMRRLLREGDQEGAARALLNEWVFAYGLNTEREAEGVIGNIERITVQVQNA